MAKLSVFKDKEGRVRLAAADEETKITSSSSGWSEVASGNGEWELYVTTTAGQGGKTRWAVILVSCDMDLDVADGICDWDDDLAAVEEAIKKMTANWITPLLA